MFRMGFSGKTNVIVNKVLGRYKGDGIRNLSSVGQYNNSKINYLGVGVFLTACLGCTYLGVWQVERYHWKVDLIEQEKVDLAQNASEIPMNLTQEEFGAYAKNLIGRRVKMQGEFMHDREILMGPRAGHRGIIGAGAQGMATNPQGYYVITPFRRADGTITFVSRGWVPLKTFTWSRPEGFVSIDVVISAHEKKNTFSPDNDADSKKIIWLEPAILPKACGIDSDRLDESSIASLVVVAELVKDDLDSTRKENPVAKRVQDIGHQHISPTIHFVYAVTWFSLAVAGLAMTYFKFRPRKIRVRPQAKAN